MERDLVFPRKSGRANRSVLRVCKRDPWWHYVWSLRTNIRVADDGTVPVIGQRLRISAPPRTRLAHCLHTNGSVTILANKRDKTTRPIILLHCGPRLDKKRIPVLSATRHMTNLILQILNTLG